MAATSSAGSRSGAKGTVYFLAAIIILTGLPDQNAGAQTPPGSIGAPSGGVMAPPAHIDPGMTRLPPDLPRQSTPVIHPRQIQKKGHRNVQIVPK